MSEYVVELLESDEPISVEMLDSSSSPEYPDAESIVGCVPDDWIMLDGYYTLSIAQTVHQRGMSARCSGAERFEGGITEAVVSYRRLTNGTILIISNVPFEGRIFIKG